MCRKFVILIAFFSYLPPSSPSLGLLQASRRRDLTSLCGQARHVLR